VAACLRPGGRAAFVDEDDRARGYHDCAFVDGTPVARRTLRDGTTFGWTATIRRVDRSSLSGVARPSHA
jgi:hypothetical protein